MSSVLLLHTFFCPHLRNFAHSDIVPDPFVSRSISIAENDSVNPSFEILHHTALRVLLPLLNKTFDAVDR
jgi:hypothetical protein